jgi:glycosyltransferase involved in cell wall biosynthesis
MRLGIMLRHFDQHDGGVKVYTRELLQSLLSINKQHEIVLLYRNPARLGMYSKWDGVTEVLLEGGSIVYWDQIKVPQAIREHGIDVLFNPKYSIPLRAKCPTAWVCHGLDWYVMPHASRWIDRMNHRLLIPQYARRASAVIAVSNTTRDHLIQYLDVKPERIHTVYSGLSEHFRRAPTPEEMAAVRERHKLPPKFLLYCGAVYPPKNFTRMIQAYATVGPARGVPLVIAGGTNRFLSEHELLEPKRLGIEKWVQWLGWLENRELPPIYALAEGLLLPSLYESVGMPVMEAMAMGCPALTSDCYGTLEIAGNAAVLVSPGYVDHIAKGMVSLLEDAALRERLCAAGRVRAQQFTWEKTATQVLDVLESISAEGRVRKNGSSFEAPSSETPPANDAAFVSAGSATMAAK